jgi:hypothetical protein
VEPEVNDADDGGEKAVHNNETKKKEGRRVLEIGSGPVPISMISASRWSEWIVCSDFLEQNRQNIKQWLTMTAITSTAPGRHDETWLPFFRYVTELERAEYFSLQFFQLPFVLDEAFFFFTLGILILFLFLIIIIFFLSKKSKMIIHSKIRDFVTGPRPSLCPSCRTVQCLID